MKKSNLNCLSTTLTAHTQLSSVEVQTKLRLEANHSQNRGLPLFFPTDSRPQSLFDLLQYLISTSHTIRAHAQEV